MLFWLNGEHKLHFSGKKKKDHTPFFFSNNTNTSPKDIHTRGNWNLSCCKNNRDLKTHQSIRGRNDHRDGLNANEKLFIKSWLKCFRWNAHRAFKGLTSFLRTFETASASGHRRFSITQKPWPDKSMAEGHPRFQRHRCSLRALIGWYMSGLLKKGACFSAAQSMACSLQRCTKIPLIKRQTLSLKSSGWLHASRRRPFN